MLSQADADVVARDRVLPGLGTLLDDDRLSELAGVSVRRRYLRYKPGTSCVVAAHALLGQERVDVLAVAYAASEQTKVGKLVRKAPAGSVLAVEPGTSVVLATAAADRDLPLLRAVGRNGADAVVRRLPQHGPGTAAALRTLSWKPMRRWVGQLTGPGTSPVVVRAFRRGAERGAARTVAALHDAGAPTPALVGLDEALASVVVEHVPGRTLDRMLREGDVPDAVLRDTGRALAALHSAAVVVPQVRGDDGAEAYVAVRHLTRLLPGLTVTAERVCREVRALLAALPAAACVVHGDFSTDQVVVGADGAPRLVDLDRAAVGDPAVDLGGLAAAAIAADPEGTDEAGVQRLLALVGEGYAQVRPLPSAASVTAHTAVALLRRAAEPFRAGDAEWDRRARAIVARAAALVEAGPPAPDADPRAWLEPVLGSPVSLQVLKDKPGRRRTSRAVGADGTAIVKAYASERAPVVAARVAAVQVVRAPEDAVAPLLPRVLLCDARRRTVVLTDVPGRPFREHLLRGDLEAARRVGSALGRWHAWHAEHREARPRALRHHDVERELTVLRERCAAAPPEVRAAVLAELPRRAAPWEPTTVVHRDLYEEQVLVGAQVGLLDLDDAAVGPPELDLGNLLAHLALLASRSGADLAGPVSALLACYRREMDVDLPRLVQCRRLSELRLACLHRDTPFLAADHLAAAVRGSAVGAEGRCGRGGRDVVRLF